MQPWIPSKKHLEEKMEGLLTKQLQSRSKSRRKPLQQRNVRSSRSLTRNTSSERARQSRHSKSKHFEEKASKFKPFKLPSWQRDSESRRKDSVVRW